MTWSLFPYLVTQYKALHTLDTLGSSPRESMFYDAGYLYTAPHDKTATRLTKIITSSATILLLKHLSSNAPASPQTSNPTSIVLSAAHLSTLQTLTRTSATLRFFLYSPSSLTTNHHFTSHISMPAPLHVTSPSLEGLRGAAAQICEIGNTRHVTVEIFGVTTTARAWLAVLNSCHPFCPSAKRDTTHSRNNGLRI